MTKTKGSNLDSSGNGVTVTSSLTTFMTFPGSALAGFVGFEIENAGATALNDLQIEFSFYDGRSGFAILAASASGDAQAWSSFIGGSSAPPIVVRGYSNTRPDTLAGGAKTWIIMDLQGVNTVTFKGKTASGTTSLKGFWTGESLKSRQWHN